MDRPETKLPAVELRPEGLELSERADHVCELLQRLIADLTYRPENILIKVERQGYSTHYIELHVGNGDYGKVNGAGGEHIKAIKDMCRMISQRGADKFEIELVERRSTPVVNKPIIPISDNWEHDKVCALIQDMFNSLLLATGKVSITDASGGKSAVDIFVSEEESREEVQRCREMLSPLLRAIGRMNGRKFTVNIIQDDAALRSALGQG